MIHVVTFISCIKRRREEENRKLNSERNACQDVTQQNMCDIMLLLRYMTTSGGQKECVLLDERGKNLQAFKRHEEMK